MFLRMSLIFLLWVLVLVVFLSVYKRATEGKRASTMKQGIKK